MRACRSARSSTIDGTIASAVMPSDHQKAVEHLQRCVEFDPKYSAAWKLLGKAWLASGDTGQARQAWEQGISAAVGHGDKQAEKEMTVFLKKLDRKA